MEGLVLHGERQSTEGARLRIGQSQLALQDGPCVRLLQGTERVCRGQEPVRPNLCRVREQYCEHTDRRGSEQCGCPCSHEWLDLRRLATGVRGGNEDRVQVIQMQ